MTITAAFWLNARFLMRSYWRSPAACTLLCENKRDPGVIECDRAYLIHTSEGYAT